MGISSEHPCLTNWCRALSEALEQLRGFDDVTTIETVGRHAFSCPPVNFVRNQPADRLLPVIAGADRCSYAVKHLEQIIGIDADRKPRLPPDEVIFRHIAARFRRARFVMRTLTEW